MRQRCTVIILTIASVISASGLVAAQTTGHAALLHGQAHDQAHGLPMWLLVLMPSFWLAAAGFVVTRASIATTS